MFLYAVAGFLAIIVGVFFIFGAYTTRQRFSKMFDPVEIVFVAILTGTLIISGSGSMLYYFNG